ncbi:AbrB/MazE/SpoVT family DNA-binding domain-containing protein [Rahnella woolbedingensis]|uniref:AbrB/MazE/SpoVT family DNA-binding domain-containing protein n=1 Tax=Rahnella woolbedingensis TaxID=1510574 RepID=A0A419N282_9GAMM|nr:AbrB/MazE/SpoVT family DNA-binding domain-containing protein [Rahnella woolbedingensis]RJT32762.1 AbrB/MazE/SpoVT family DNA-binding domain-containing protein [Rahnella woolbedingensis]
MTTVTLKKWGNSPSIRIPVSVMQAASLSVDDQLELSVEEGRLILIPVKAKEYSLDALLSKITAANLHEKIDFGPAVGKELL